MHEKYCKNSHCSNQKVLDRKKIESYADHVRNSSYLKWIEVNPEDFDKIMIKRKCHIRAIDILKLYRQWRTSKQSIEQINQELNKNNDQITQILRKKESIPTDLLNLSNHLKQKVSEEVNNERIHRNELTALGNTIPNLLDAGVPEGSTDEDNIVISEYGARPNIANPMHHEEIAIEMNCWGRKEATNMCGSRFVILGGELAALERALFQFALDYLIRNGFYELSVPYIVNKGAIFNTGQLPKFEEDYFKVEDQCLIPTGEVPLLNYFANTTIDQTQKLCTFTQCFRKEAGSLGKDTKGMIRLHQFGKVEMVCITKNEDSHTIHMEMLNHSKKLLELLELPYRVIKICGGDTGFTAALQFDIEVWMPSQNKYVEVVSCSNCWDFQAQRAGIKFKDEKGVKSIAHTLNGTAISGRVLAAILEHFYKNHSLFIPSVIKSYLDT